MKRFIAFVSILLGVASMACAPDPYVIHGDSRATEEQRVALIEGEAWLARQAGHEPYGIVFDAEDGWVGGFNRALVVGEMPKDVNIEHGGLCQGTKDGGFIIYVKGVDLKDMPGVMAHEMAHCRFGFKDAYGKDDVPSEGIMRVLTPMRWTSAEEKQCEDTKCREGDK